MERQVFPVTDNRCLDSRKSYDGLGCGTDQSQDGYFKSYWPREAVVGCRLQQVYLDLCRKFIVWRLSFCVEQVSFLLWNRSSSYMYNANYSVVLLQISFYIYACLVCFMQQRKTQRVMAVWECYCIFHFVVEVKVTCIYVERNTTFCYAYHYIRKYCVFNIYLTIAVGNGCHLSKVLLPWVHGAAQARRRKTLQVSKDSRAVCS